MPEVLVDLSTQPPASRVGGKAARLGWLIHRGRNVPAAVAIPFDTAAALAEPPTAQRVLEELTAWMQPHETYCVRSSADVEDHGRQTFAGQFTSLTGVVGAEAALAAAREVVASVASDRVRQYAARVGVDPAGLRMAVIVQRMVPAAASGVAFSSDPVTGADEVVVEAVPGAGEDLMGLGATPQRWTTDTRDRAVAPEAPVLTPEVHQEIVDTVRGIARDSGETVDLEWVWDGHRLHVVQWRPLSSLARTPRIWSSRMARDMLPGLIPPLVWSVNVPVLSRTWVDLVREAIGDTGLDADELVRPFGYRAYFNASAFGRVFESLGMPADAMERMREGDAAMMPSPSALASRAPAMLRFGRTLAAWPRHALPVLAEVEGRYREEARLDLAGLSDAGLLARTDRLLDLLAAIARLNIVTPLLADAWASAIRRTAARAGIDPQSIDPGQEVPAVRSLSPAHVLVDIDPADDRAWSDFLTRFGHLSDSPNDCSQPTWAEQSDAVRESLSGGGRDVPRLPGGGSPARSLETGQASDARAALLAAVPAWRRRLLARRWSRIALLRLVRERVGYVYARVYGLFRPTFLEAGRRLADRGVLDERDDVFLLTLDELRRALGAMLPDAAALVARRRAEMDDAADLHWPERIVGDDPVPIRGRAGARVLTGVPTSHGRHTGRARVITSLAGAGDIAADDVIVLPAADVTWTPLLVRAGAVVTQTGGMLSHASIVARELGLPCVASVDGALDIPDGCPISIDGGTGEVLLLTDDAMGVAT